MLMEKNENDLLKKAFEARKNAYAPYSHFLVGAALLTAEGEIFTGGNIENASYSVTLCAERAAMAAAISRGYRHFTALAVVGGREGEDLPLCPPCGTCRQFISEFCSPDFPVITARLDQNGLVIEKRVNSLSELLPDGFLLEKPDP